MLKQSRKATLSRYIPLLTIALLITAVAACGGGGEDDGDPRPPPASSATGPGATEETAGGEEQEPAPTRRGLLGRSGSSATNEPEAEEETRVREREPDGDSQEYPEGDFLSVSSGSDHTCGIKKDGTLACWGGNKDGQSTPPGGSLSR